MGNAIVFRLRNVMKSDSLSIKCTRALSITIYSRISTKGSRESGILFYIIYSPIAHMRLGKALFRIVWPRHGVARHYVVFDRRDMPWHVPDLL